ARRRVAAVDRAGITVVADERRPAEAHAGLAVLGAVARVRVVAVGVGRTRLTGERETQNACEPHETAKELLHVRSPPTLMCGANRTSVVEQPPCHRDRPPARP